MVEYIHGEGFESLTIIRANGLAVVYSDTEPVDLLEAGAAVGLEDFQDATRTMNLSKGIGTRALKETISYLAEDEYPFAFVERLTGSISGHGICTNFGYLGVKLNNFYVRTQALHDHITEMSQIPVKQWPHSLKTFSVIQSVIFDDDGIL